MRILTLSDTHSKHNFIPTRFIENVDNSLDTLVHAGDVSSRGYKGEIIWDSSKLDGTPKRLLSSDKLFNMGWKPKIALKDGLEKSYNWFVSQNL